MALGKSASKQCYYSSSDSLSDSEEQQCYLADQVKAKRRASSRVSFSLDNKVSKAVSQYSDEDENYDSLHKVASHTQDANLDCKLLSSPCHLSMYLNSMAAPPAMNRCTSFIHISDSCSSTTSTKKLMPHPDKNARARCFNYLVEAIDEAWARYCDVASHIENEAYGYNTPQSVVTDDDDDVGHSTDFTDYESDFEQECQVPKPTFNRKPSIFGTSYQQQDNTLSSRDPLSCQLQALKDRLIKAKYFLQDLVDTEDAGDAAAFWKRWDMIKYATIELVEDDDDDEVIESTIDDLENGRSTIN